MNITIEEDIALTGSAGGIPMIYVVCVGEMACDKSKTISSKCGVNARERLRTLECGN